MYFNLVSLFSVDAMVELFISLYAQCMGCKIYEKVFTVKTIKAIRRHMETLKEYATDNEHFSWDIQPATFYEDVEVEMKNNGDMEFLDGREWENTEALSKAFRLMRDMVFEDSNIASKFFAV